MKITINQNNDIGTENVGLDHLEITSCNISKLINAFFAQRKS